jgi:hypothetical protein
MFSSPWSRQLVGRKNGTLDIQQFGGKFKTLGNKSSVLFKVNSFFSFLTCANHVGIVAGRKHAANQGYC